MTNYLRPDELASQTEIEKSRRRTNEIRTGLEAASSLGTASLGIKAAGNITSKILPFLNEYIPADLAMKGISKVAPQVGEFLKNGMSQGLDLKSGLDFLKQNLVKGSQQKPPEQRSIIEQYSPELYQFLKGEIDKGRAPLEAGALAQLQDPFKKIIKKMSDDHKAPFSSILQSVFGNGMQQSNQISTAQPMQTQSQNQQQSGGGDQALLAALDKILKM